MLAIRKLILRRLLNALLSQPGNVVIDSERGFDPDNRTFYNLADLDEAVTYALEFDEVHIFSNTSKEFNRRDGYGPFVYIIFGNGNCDLDMLSDYSTSLGLIIEPINQMIEGLQDGSVELTVKS